MGALGKIRPRMAPVPPAVLAQLHRRGHLGASMAHAIRTRLALPPDSCAPYSRQSSNTDSRPMSKPVIRINTAAPTAISAINAAFTLSPTGHHPRPPAARESGHGRLRFQSRIALSGSRNVWSVTAEHLMHSTKTVFLPPSCAGPPQNGHGLSFALRCFSCPTSVVHGQCCRLTPPSLWLNPPPPPASIHPHTTPAPALAHARQ